MDTSIAIKSPMRIHESDFMDNLSLQGIMQRFQEASEDYTESLHCSCSFLSERYGISWMLALMHLEMYDYPHTGDMIETRLWPVERDSILMPWYYVLSDGNGRIYGAACQSWMIVDIHKRKILKPSALPAEIIPDTDHDKPCIPAKKKIVMPENMTSIGNHPVVYSDTDMNGHMNNTKYTATIMDAFPEDFHRQHVVKEFDCFFKKETSIGHNLELFASDLKNREVFINIMDGKEETIRCRILWS